MDWLRKYDRVVLCAKRAIQLTKEDGITTEFVPMVQTDQLSMVNQVKGISLEEIMIV
jgi:DNA-directed RNA polymerase subunit K/omega